ADDGLPDGEDEDPEGGEIETAGPVVARPAWQNEPFSPEDRTEHTHRRGEFVARPALLAFTQRETRRFARWGRFTAKAIPRKDAQERSAPLRARGIYFQPARESSMTRALSCGTGRYFWSSSS